MILRVFLAPFTAKISEHSLSAYPIGCLLISFRTRPKRKRLCLNLTGGAPLQTNLCHLMRSWAEALQLDFRLPGFTFRSRVVHAQEGTFTF